MKLLKLEINAFGPFAGYHEIDFTKLENNQIYLITGKTGAGKTTIFDAVCCALYADASGTGRKPENFKSHYADQKEICWVRLEFEFRGEIYKIYREPLQQKLNKKGKITDHKHKVELVLPDLECITAVEQANKKIQEILGLDKNQFRQIAMLPQGEFRKFLYSSGDEKIRIFRHIFSTNIYQSVENIFKEKEKQERGKIAEYQSKLDSCLYYVKLNNSKSNEIYTELENSENVALYSELDDLLNQEYKNVKNILEVLEKKIHSDNSLIELLNNDYKAIQEKIQNINIDEAKQKNNNIYRFNQIDIELNNLKANQEEFNLSKIKLEKAKKAYQVKNIEKDVIRLKNDYENICRFISQVEKDIELAQEKLMLAESNLSENKSREILQENLNNKIIKLQNIKDFITEKNNLSIELETCEKKINLANQRIYIFDLLSQRLEKRKEIEELDKELEEILNCIDIYNQMKKSELEYSTANLKYAEAYNKYLYAQAGILAENLLDNEPCPVCGSKEHPNPARFSDNIISEDAIKKLALRKENLYNIYIDLKNKLENNITNYNQKINNASLDNLDLLNELKNFKIQIENNIFDKNQEYNIINQNCFDSFKDKTQLDNDKFFDKEYINSEVKNQNNILNSYESRKIILIEQIDKVNIKIPENIEDLNSVLKEEEKLNSNLLLVKKEIEKSVSKHKESLIIVERLSGQIEELIKNKISKVNEISKHEEYFNNLIVTNGFKSEEEYNKFYLDLEQINLLEKKINDFENSLYKLDAEQKILDNILRDKNIVDISVLQENIDNLSLESNKLDKIRVDLLSTIESNKSQQKEVKKLNKKMCIYEEEYNDIAFLKDLAVGNNSKKISFESYVLISYFKNVISAANMRLVNMTNGQYKLVYKTERDKGNVKSGLSMEIFDSYTGRTRAITTLSGGESFKFSLALALGLSDVIQNYCGGIEINTMFIDEGFGSLDQASIEDAINILIDLKQNNKTIGIISHVQELKEKLPVHLEVKSGKQGSDLKFVFN